MIPAAFLQELLARVDVVEVVGRHVELKKAGINHKGLCPFHGEKSPSFIVSPSRQTYHCFGCGAHGDAIRFLTEQGGLSFPDAVRELAQQVGIKVPEDQTDPAERERAQQARAHELTLTDVLERARAHYSGQLKSAPRAIDYLKRRGLTGAIAARFGLGYAPEGWRSLASAFGQYDDPLLVEAGLVIVQGEPDQDQKRYDRFRDRIMFPIRSVKGGVIGFGGRVIDQGEPKYLNSPETPVFSKGRELYGLFEARQAIRERGHVMVVEGYMDVVAMAQSGFGNAVATLGTACTAEHVHKLFRHTDSVIFSFDGDAAGQRAAARALESALPHATDLRTIRFLFLPPEHDPDSFLREVGIEAFESAIAAAVPLSRQLIVQASHGQDMNTAEGRAKMLALARPLWDALPAGLLRSQVLGALAEAAQMLPSALEAAWSDARPAPHPAARTRQVDAGTATQWRTNRRPSTLATTNLLDRAACLLSRNATLWFDLPAPDHELLASQPLPHGLFFRRLDQWLHEHGDASADALLDDALSGESAQELKALVDRIRALHQFDDDEAPQAQLVAAVARLRQQAIEDELEILMESGELSESATRRRSELMAQRAALKRAAAAAKSS